MYRYLLILFIIILGSISCTKQNNDRNQIYLKHKSFFPDEFVDHFPIELKAFPSEVYSRFYRYGWTNTQFELSTIIDTTNKNLIDSLVAFSVAQYSAHDTCLNIVNRMYNINNKSNYNIHLSKREKIRFHIPCIVENYPVPNFYENKYVDTESKNRLSADFLIYVLEAKSGKYGMEKHLTKGLQMSDQWKNGYSKGIAVSEEKSIVIFWFIIW